MPQSKNYDINSKKNIQPKFPIQVVDDNDYDNNGDTIRIQNIKSDNTTNNHSETVPQENIIGINNTLSDEELDAQALRLCVGSQDFDMYSPIRSRGSGSVCDDNMHSRSYSSPGSSQDEAGYIGGGNSFNSVGVSKSNHHMSSGDVTFELDEERQQYFSARDIIQGENEEFAVYNHDIEERYPSGESEYYNTNIPQNTIINDGTDRIQVPSLMKSESIQCTNTTGSISSNGKWRFLTNEELLGLNIVIMIVGTHGDVLPFLGIAHSLKELGHRVRIATHECHHGLVESQNIEFYPLAGNPKLLSEFMVKTSGNVIGMSKNPKLLVSNTRMVKEIIKSTWKACTEVDPSDENETPFVVDAIISNPATMGHIHVAEALAVPLHIMFPQPWYYGTNDMAHPMLYHNTPTEGGPLKKILKDKINSKKNSYAAWEIVQFQTFGKTINKWRQKKLHLPHVQRSWMRDTIPKEKVPFSAMWSPQLLPKPNDWPDQCQVIGTCNFKPGDGKNKEFDPIEAGLSDLLHWLSAGPKPIFIGFGSMMIDNTEQLANMIMTAAEKVKCRILVQHGWSKLDVSSCKHGQDVSCPFGGPLCFNVKACPHDWLLPHCSAVIHHGGAGTTAAGLLHGLPTFICPFFADQYLWADKVYEANVGPKFCPVKELSVDILVYALQQLRNPIILNNAKNISIAMKQEDGIQGAMDHFMDFLPVDNMFCDVSMLMGEVRRARYFLPGSRLKVSVEFAALIETKKVNPNFFKWFTEVGAFQMRRYAVTKYSISGGINNIWEGIYYGFVGSLFQIAIQAPYKLFHVPDKYAYRCGAFGFCFGCFVGPFQMIFKILYAILYFVDCVVLGIVNGFSNHKRDYICNRFRKDNSYVYRHANIELEKENIQREGIKDERVLALLQAARIAVDARRVFDFSNPKENLVHKSVEVNTTELCACLKNYHIYEMNKLKRDELIETLSNMGENESLSFSHFCKILNIVLYPRVEREDEESNSIREISINFSNRRCDIYSSDRMDDLEIQQLQQRGKKDGPLSIRVGVDAMSQLTGIRGRAVSVDNALLRTTRSRTWSDGIASRIDEFSETVAGGRVRSKSPKARYYCTSPDNRYGRLRTHSEEMKSGSIQRYGKRWEEKMKTRTTTHPKPDDLV